MSTHSPNHPSSASTRATPSIRSLLLALGMGLLSASVVHAAPGIPKTETSTGGNGGNGMTQEERIGYLKCMKDMEQKFLSDMLSCTQKYDESFKPVGYPRFLACWGRAVRDHGLGMKVCADVWGKK